LRSEYRDVGVELRRMRDGVPDGCELDAPVHRERLRLRVHPRILGVQRDGDRRLRSEHGQQRAPLRQLHHGLQLRQRECGLQCGRVLAGSVFG
jgi:hypothetical protein